MKTSNVSYPHPVLGHGDDVQGDYKGTVNPYLSGSDILLKVEHKLINASVTALIAQGIASFCVEVHCESTFFRELFKNTDKESEIRIKASLLERKVKVTYFVIANADLDNYTVDGLAQDYEDMGPIAVKKGDLLAYGGEMSFIAGKSRASILAPNNFMKIVPVADSKTPGINLTTLSTKTQAANSPPERTKSPIEMSNVI